jgi:hypothetical protein
LGAAVSVVMLALTISLLWLANLVERKTSYGGHTVGRAGGRVVGLAEGGK